MIAHYKGFDITIGHDAVGQLYALASQGDWQYRINNPKSQDIAEKQIKCIIDMVTSGLSELEIEEARIEALGTALLEARGENDNESVEYYMLKILRGVVRYCSEENESEYTQSVCRRALGYIGV